MLKSIILDLDGTLCDTSHREHHIDKHSMAVALTLNGDAGVQKCWDNFHEGMGDDTCNMDILHMLDCMVSLKTDLHKYGVIIITGRPERYRDRTMKWLRDFLVPCDALIMRPDGDKTPTEVYKIQALERWLGTKEEVLEKVAFCLEDRDKVVEAFRAYGLPAWQVRKGAY